MTEGEATTKFFWMSFCDSDKPKGSQFLGVILVRGVDIQDAMTNSWLMGINPGGEVAFMAMDIPYSQVNMKFVNRLLGMDQAKEAQRWVEQINSESAA